MIQEKFLEENQNTHFMVNNIFYLLKKYTATYLLSHSTVQSPSSAANRFAASQEIPHISRNPKFHYLSHKCPPPAPILSQLDPVYTPTFHFLKIHLNIILPSGPGSSRWALSLRFPHQNLMYVTNVNPAVMPHTVYGHCPDRGRAQVAICQK